MTTEPQPPWFRVSKRLMNVCEICLDPTDLVLISEPYTFVYADKKTEKKKPMVWRCILHAPAALGVGGTCQHKEHLSKPAG